MITHKNGSCTQTNLQEYSSSLQELNRSVAFLILINLKQLRKIGKSWGKEVREAVNNWGNCTKHFPNSNKITTKHNTVDRTVFWWSAPWESLLWLTHLEDKDSSMLLLVTLNVHLHFLVKCTLDFLRIPLSSLLDPHSPFIVESTSRKYLRTEWKLTSS